MWQHVATCGNMWQHVAMQSHCACLQPSGHPPILDHRSRSHWPWSWKLRLPYTIPSPRKRPWAKEPHPQPHNDNIVLSFTTLCSDLLLNLKLLIISDQDAPICRSLGLKQPASYIFSWRVRRCSLAGRNTHDQISALFPFISPFSSRRGLLCSLIVAKADMHTSIAGKPRASWRIAQACASTLAKPKVDSAWWCLMYQDSKACRKFAWGVAGGPAWSFGACKTQRKCPTSPRAWLPWLFPWQKVLLANKRVIGKLTSVGSRLCLHQ